MRWEVPPRGFSGPWSIILQLGPYPRRVGWQSRVYGPIQYQIAAFVDDLRDLALSFMVYGSFFVTGGGQGQARPRNG